MSMPKLSIHALRSLGRAIRHPLAWRGGTLGPRFREQLILRVSSINRCFVCSAIHGAVAHAVGVTGEQVREARSSEPASDERTRIALRYAELRTTETEADFPADVQAFEQAFGPEEKLEVRAIVDLFTFNNRFNNSWEAVLPGASGRRKNMGMVP